MNLDEPDHIGALRETVRRFVAGNIGGDDKVAGFWNQYSANAQVSRWYYVDK